MQQLDQYKRKSISSGMTRVEMLLMLYDKALASVEACQIANEVGDDALFRKHEIQARKVLVAIISGLQPDEDEVAYNIARLLEFVLFSFDERHFDSCQKILGQIRNSFAQIADQANEMERNGEISPMPDSDSFQSIA
ncbi:flagellar protein FliS [Roseiconus lacunae]|uniref:Flagellar protein FliS n=1 Tax=Roseiconus lacunae TaxID=2605694 RepID=A0ABT7PGD3_9BACT|nr:flagellar protein FliS [Roseiconus lacunae]MCD0459913.1 flagellar protein FliS [Roseiconus lacunae]MDM4015311.1 flagellar protein FliS [Roseiconus lacunae]WRQ49933.1 flagellar protein FliS [Stieleria sp. HD01]